MQIPTFSQASFHQAARYLLAMRGAIIVAELLMLAIFWHLELLDHRIQPALATITAHCVMTTMFVIWFRFRPPRHNWAFTLSLFADLLLIGLWLHFTGGYTNPLTSLLLLPLAMAIVLVPMGQSLMLAVASVVIYRELMIWYSPVIVHHHNLAYLERLHLDGMWLAFILTAIVLLLVVGSLVARFRDLQAALIRAREEKLRDEQIITLGLSAATAAHRMGTPVNTMALLLNEIRHDPRSEPLSEEIRLLEEQLDICAEYLRDLSTSAVRVQGSDLETIPLTQWISRLKESATLLWPASALSWDDAIPLVRLSVDATLDQAVLNIIGNALRTSVDYVHVSTRRENGQVALEIEDHGDGLQEWMVQRLGGKIIESESGLGIGLFLSNATIQRLGGVLRAQVDDSGTRMTILLPEHEGEVGIIDNYKWSMNNTA